MSRIRDVEAKKGYRLLIELQGGNVVFLNMSDKIDTIRFYDLKDEEFFNTVQTDGTSLYWDYGRIKIGVTEIYDMINETVNNIRRSRFSNGYDYNQHNDFMNQNAVG